MTKLRRRLAIAGAIIFLAIAAGYFAITRTIDHFLKEGALDRALGRKTAVTLHADTGYLPLFWRGLSVHSDGLLVRGKPPRALRELRAADLQAYCSLRDLWQRKWRINRLQANRLEVAFGAAAFQQLTNTLSSEPELQPQVDEASPLKLVIRETLVRQTNIFWGETQETVGGLRNVESKYYPNGSALDATGTGGVFRQTGWPEVRVIRIQAHYARPKLQIQSAIFAIGKTEDMAVEGELDFAESGGGLHLRTRSWHAPVESFLSGFWRGKFEGTFGGETEIEKKFEKDGRVNASGELNFEHAEVHDVATLNRIAAVTHHPQFEHLRLNELRGRYKWTGAKLEVTELRMEEKNLFRIEGAFAIAKEEIEGNFQVGATGDVLSAIPGAREKVFTESRDGYFWTSMKLSGPMSHPREDLKQRLVSAAEEQLARGFLAPIFKPGKTLLEMLNALYQ